MTFVCVMRSGGDFGIEDAAVLYNAVSRYVPLPWQFLCLSDEQAVFGARHVHAPLITDWPGWWAKMELFRPCFRQFYPMLYLDLDTAILGNLIKMFQHGPDTFGMLRDFHTPKRPASGVMWFPKGWDPSGVWKDFSENPTRMEEHDAGGDQSYLNHVTQSLKIPVTMLQDCWQGQMYSFKPTRERLLHEPEQSTRLVCFHGAPRPREAINQVGWVKEYYEKNGVTEDQLVGGVPGDMEMVRPITSSRGRRGRPPRRASRRLEAPMYKVHHTGTLIVVGSARGAVEEYERVRAARPEAKVLVIGHAAGMVKADFVVTDHYEVHEELKGLQSQFHSDFSSHCAWMATWFRWPAVDYWWKWKRSECTSVHSAIRLGLVTGFTEIILCGSPLEAGKIQHPDQVKKDGERWPPPFVGKAGKNNSKTSASILKQVRGSFAERSPVWKKMGVRSMCGYTRELLGEPEL